MSTQTLDLTVVGWIGTRRRRSSRRPTAAGRTRRSGSAARAVGSTAAPARGGTAETEWFTVKVWRALAVNVARSLRKGDPVIVQGRLSTEEWVVPTARPRTSLVLEAVTRRARPGVRQQPLRAGRSTARRRRGHRAEDDRPPTEARQVGSTDRRAARCRRTTERRPRAGDAVDERRARRRWRSAGRVGSGAGDPTTAGRTAAPAAWPTASPTPVEQCRCRRGRGSGPAAAPSPEHRGGRRASG